jgi:hypothetical protein
LSFAEEDEERDGIQLDLYGVKLRVAPTGELPAEPKSWRDVARELNQELRAALSNAVGILGDTLRAARSLVRAIGGLPDRRARQVAAAHERVDRALALRTAETTEAEPRADLALDRLQALIRRKAVEGYTARAFLDSKGERIVFCFLPPSDARETEAVALTALSAMDDLSTLTGPQRRRKRKRKRKAASASVKPEPPPPATTDGPKRPRRRFRRRRNTSST